MSFFDQAYDEMSWEEICYRLPSEMAVSALQRRINNLDTLKMFFDNVGSQPKGVKSLKDHVNETIANEEPEDIMEAFDEKYEQVLFNWLDNNNQKRIKEQQSDKLSTKFLFNVTESGDRDGLKTILDRVLEEDPISQAHLKSVLNKTDDEHFNSMIDTVLKDSRPEVRACVLGVGGGTNNLVSDHQKVIGLKALVKCSSRLSTMCVLNINIFSNLRPLERLQALEIYLDYFPRFKKVSVFNPVPSKEEFDMLLFSGCIEHHERVEKISEIYKDITERDPPEKEEEE